MWKCLFNNRFKKKLMVVFIGTSYFECVVAPSFKEVKGEREEEYFSLTNRVEIPVLYLCFTLYFAE